MRDNPWRTSTIALGIVAALFFGMWLEQTTSADESITSEHCWEMGFISGYDYHGDLTASEKRWFNSPDGEGVHPAQVDQCAFMHVRAYDLGESAGRSRYHELRDE